MEIIKETTYDKVRKAISKVKTGDIVVLARDDEFNRKVLENKGVDVLVDVESGNKKDRLRQRDSGLNQVLCKIARGNNVGIGIDLSHLNEGSDSLRAEYLGRLLQNIRLCKKYGVRMVLINVKMDKDINGLLLTLGMDTRMAKFAFEHSFSFN